MLKSDMQYFRKGTHLASHLDGEMEKLIDAWGNPIDSAEAKPLLESAEVPALAAPKEGRPLRR